MATRGKGRLLTGLAYESVRAGILNGRFPPGSPLRLAALAGDFGVSMSVVREALTRMSEQGLVVATPNQGFRVTPLSREDLLDLTDLRANLESLALERSIARGDVQWEADVVSLHHVLERTALIDPETGLARPEWIAAHAAFHDALGASCGSRRLLALVRSMRDSAEIYRQWSGPFGHEAGRDVAAEHRALMELATARDADAAGRTLRAHIERTSAYLLDARDAALDADAAVGTDTISA